MQYKLFVLAYILMLAGCFSRHVVTVLEPDRAVAPGYSRIMVAAIVKERSDSVRQRIELALVKQLSDLGYNAISSVRTFGTHGLRDLGEDVTYIALCESGIDAVLVLAMIDKESMNGHGKSSKKSTSLYYYNRIWHYAMAQEKLGNIDDGTPQDFEWESILFDLSKLQPHSVIQLKKSREVFDSTGVNRLTRTVVKEMFPKRAPQERKAF